MAVNKDKNTQILVTFPNDMITEIEKHWHKEQLKNRNEAIRHLVSIALKKTSQK